MTSQPRCDCVSWPVNLSLFHYESEACFVYRFLLARSDLGSHASTANNFAIAWLGLFH